MTTANLIPRKVFFDNADHIMVRLSPDGSMISYIAPYKGVLNIWVAPRDDILSAEPITFEDKRGIRAYSWAYTGAHILYQKDTEGDENWHINVVDIATKKSTDLTPIDGISARITKQSKNFPQHILVSINDRTPELHDIYKIDILTGQRELAFENPGYVGFLCDDGLELRFGLRLLSDGSTVLDIKDKDSWQEYQQISYEDSLNTSPLGFNKKGDKLYMLDSRGRDTAALYQIDIASKERILLAEDAKADISDAFFHPTTKEFEGWASTYLKKEWRFVDPDVKADYDFLAKDVCGQLEVAGRDLQDQYWIVVDVIDDGASEYYLFNRNDKSKKHLCSSHKRLQGLELCKMHPVVIKSRDNLEMVSYYTLPLTADPHQTGKADKPVPLVLLVHGGPQARDNWGYDGISQWLANRGYAVLSVNYRSSTGFGKKFINAGDGEWSRKAHDDLIDAVEWAISQKITTREQVAIMGGSYGGYATLVGLTYTPDVFACGVDIVGPSNLETLMETVPAYWKPILDMLKRRVGGDLDTPEGRAELAARSPIHKASEIKKPLLIAQGANDPRVKQAESDQFADALKAKGIPVTYVLYPDEGHGFANPGNRMSFFAITDAFLQEHLGGHSEPAGDDFKDSSHEILAAGPEVAKILEEVA